MDLDCKEKVTIMGERVENHERILDTLVEVGQQNARTLAYIRGRIETAKIIKLDE